MEPGNVLAQVIFISAVLAKVIERVRFRLPKLDGDLVSLTAWVIGVGIAWTLGLDVAEQLTGTSFVVPVNYVVSGLAIGLGSGAVADVIGRSGTTVLTESVDTVVGPATINVETPPSP